MNKRKKLVYVGIPLFLLLLVIGFSETKEAKASYTSNIEIDGVEDEGYSELIQIENYNISYANDGTWHFIYIVSVYNLSINGVTITKDSFTTKLVIGTIETDYLESNIANNTLELKILRDLVGDSLEFDTTYDIFILALSPRSGRSGDEPPIIIEEESSDGEKEAGSVTFVDWLNSLFERMTFGQGILLGALAGLFFSSCVIMLWRYAVKPICFFKGSESHKASKLGRFFGEEESKELEGHWKLRFKSRFRGVTEVYCLFSFSKIDSTVWRKVYGLEKEYPFWTLITRKLQEYEYFEEKPIKKNWKYYLFRFVCVFNFNNKITASFYDALTKEKELVVVKEVPYLYFDIMMEEMTHVCDINFIRNVIDEKHGSTEKDFKLEGVPEYYADDLEKDKTVKKDSINIVKKYTLITQHKDIIEAVRNAKSIMEVRNIMEAKLRNAYNEVKRLNEELTFVKEELRLSEIEHKKEVQEAMIRAKADMSSVKDLGKYTADLLAEIDGGAKIEDAVNIAVREYHASKDYKNVGELREKVVKLEGLIESKNQLIEQYKQIIEKNGGRSSLLNKIKMPDNFKTD